ncbi:MAG: HEAT repeat domain-containing protein [Candidatus Omnitrophica bacterium]|nr:HEAT repeat domain-containing protein [Candidatus Omnitrophota bacterium]
MKKRNIILVTMLLIVMVICVAIKAENKPTTGTHALSVKERIERINDILGRITAKYKGQSQYGVDLSLIYSMTYSKAIENVASTANENDIKEIIQELNKANPSYKGTIISFLGYTKNKFAQEALLKLMNDENELIRSQAIRALIISGNRDENVVEKAVEIQKAKLKSENWQERLGAVSMLRIIGGKKAAKALLLVIDDSEPQVRQQAIYALRVLHEDNIVKDLILYLNTKKDSPKAAIFRIFGETDSKEAVPTLIQSLQDMDSNVSQVASRQEAAIALGKIKDERAIPSLIKALEDENKKVRIYAARSLGLLGSKEGYDTVLKYKDDPDWMIREEVAKALRYIGDEKALPILEEMKKRASGATYEQICAAIISIKSKNINDIGKIKVDIEFEKMLVSFRAWDLPDKSLQEDIEKITGMKMRDILIKMIEDFKGPEGSDWSFRESTIALLSKVEGEAAYPVLFKLLKDENGAIRRRAIISLQRLNYRKEEVLQEIVTNETDDTVLGDAIKDSIGIGNDAILKKYLEILEMENYPYTKSVILDTLSIIGDRKTVLRIFTANTNNTNQLIREKAIRLVDLFK